MHTRHPFYKKSPFIITCCVLLFLGAILRLSLPSLALKLVNHQLAHFSPHIHMEIEDLDMQVTRGEYNIRKFQASIKDTQTPFLHFDRINILTNWKNIWQGELIARIYADGLSVTLSRPVIDLLNSEKDQIHRALTNSHFEIKKLFLTDSHIYFRHFDYAIHDINLEMTNMNAFVMTASVFGPAPARISGTIDLRRIPVQWNIDLEMKDFDLTTIKQLLKDHWHIDLTQGSMDLYAEIESIGDEVFGYMKPFVTGLKMVGPHQKLDMDLERTVASKIPIGFGSGFKFEIMDFLIPGIEDRIGPSEIQAQEGHREF